MPHRTSAKNDWPKLASDRKAGYEAEFYDDTLRELIECNRQIIYKINSDSVGVVGAHHSARQLKRL